MNIPHKFTFHNGDNLLKLTNINGDYFCTLPHVEADRISSAYYERTNVEHKLHTGKWKIVADLSVAEKEPEMKFPFTFKGRTHGDRIYTVNKHPYRANAVIITSDVGTGDVTIEQAREAIKSGTWVVQSVGEQEAKEEPAKYPVEFGDCITIDKKGNAQGHGLTMEKHTVGNISKLTISVGSEGIDETTAKMEKLASAVEAVVIAFESLEAVTQRMGISFGGKLESGAEPFCFEEI
jgi:hypothetical protein